MQYAGFFGKILSAISAFGHEKTETGTAEPYVNSDKNSLQENNMGTASEFVTRHSTHFCPKCGWCDTLEVTMEKKTWTEPSGKTDTSYYYINTDKKPECPKCNTRSVLPLTVNNMPAAVKYLLQALQ